MEFTRQRTNPTEDKFPYKVELHVHLDGAMRLSTLFELARNKGLDVGCKTVEEFRERVCVYKAHSLYKFLQSFTVFMPIIAGDRDAISRIAYEFCEDCASNKIRYVEARYSPQLLADNEERPEYAGRHGDLTPKEVVRIISEQFKKGSNDFGIRVKSILCCMRHRPDWADEVVDLAAEFRDDGVVGIDIAGGSEDKSVEVEHVFPGHINAFKKAHTLGIHRTAHAGEASSAEKVKLSLDELLAERIGHGYKCADDEKVYEEIKARFAKDGINFSLNSDDPLVFDSCLQDDYTVAKQAGLTDKQIVQAIFNAARACFAPTEEKDELIRELEIVYKDFEH